MEFSIPGKLDHKPSGRVDFAEIDYCRQDVRATVGLLKAVKQEFDLHPPVVLAASKDRPLFISSQSEAEIVQTLALRSTMYIWGGPILSLICFWYLLVRLGYQ